MNEDLEKAAVGFTDEPMQDRAVTPTEEGDTEVYETEAPEAGPSDVRRISINPLNSGYMVKVGCQSVAVESTEKLIDMLNKYLTDPTDFERKWYSKNVCNRLDNIQ